MYTLSCKSRPPNRQSRALEISLLPRKEYKRIGWQREVQLPTSFLDQQAEVISLGYPEKINVINYGGAHTGNNQQFGEPIQSVKNRDNHPGKKADDKRRNHAWTSIHWCELSQVGTVVAATTV